MRANVIFTWILVVFQSTIAVQSQYYSQSQPYVPKAVKVTNLHFFLHETIGHINPTAVIVAQPDNSSSSISFGTLYANDNPLKIGPEDTSEVIGNSQGLAVIGDKNSTSVVMYLDYGFTTGKFNGSSISIFSRNPTTEIERELAVVGGRGKFRMAEGFARTKTYFINATSLIVEYNVTVIHYKDDDDN